jgi:hypothetical protein
MALTITVKTAANATLGTITLTDAQQTALLNDLPGEQGIADWVIAAINGKISSCTTRMADEAMALVRSSDIPFNTLTDLAPASLVSALLDYSGYEDRETRDANQP